MTRIPIYVRIVALLAAVGIASLILTVHGADLTALGASNGARASCTNAVAATGQHVFVRAYVL